MNDRIFKTLDVTFADNRRHFNNFRPRANNDENHNNLCAAIGGIVPPMYFSREILRYFLIHVFFISQFSFKVLARNNQEFLMGENDKKDSSLCAHLGCGHNCHICGSDMKAALFDIICLRRKVLEEYALLCSPHRMYSHVSNAIPSPLPSFKTVYIW
jgi:hypothetical protein